MRPGRITTPAHLSKARNIVLASPVRVSLAVAAVFLTASANGLPGSVTLQTDPVQANWRTDDATSFAYDSKMGSQARRAAAESVKRLNEERQKQLSRDSAKLIVMASKLKAEVDNGNRNKLSAGTIQRAAEIEKLAHQVQEKMKTVYSW